MSSIRNRAIGERIRLTRKRRGITQRELADRLGVTPSVVSSYEQGAVISEERLAQIAGVLEVAVADLMQGVPLVDLTREEVMLVRALRGLPAEGRAYVARLMAGLASGEVAR